MTDLNGKWLGTVIYGPDYGDLENSELYFSIDIQQDEETFTGIAADTGGIGVNPSSASVRGFMQDDEISFVKQYQWTVSFNENNSKIIDKNKLHPEVNYWGKFDPLTNTMEGEWEMIESSQSVSEGWLESISSGTWTMRRA